MANKKILISALSVVAAAVLMTAVFSSCSSNDGKDSTVNVNVNVNVNGSVSGGKSGISSEQGTENNSENGSAVSENDIVSSTGAVKTNEKPNNSGNTGKNEGSKVPNAAHQHVWKEHTAQKWVSKMVTVPDYETKKVPVGTKYIFAYDGYTTTSDSDAEQHAMELILAGHPDNYRMETIYETKTVQVGSHQEDKGHYEKYVDYHYCDCGARK